MTEPTPANGARRADELHEVNESVRRGDWVHPNSVLVPGATSALGPAEDPVDALAGVGIPGLVDLLAPLREAQQWYAGDPAPISAYAENWLRVAQLAREAGEQFGTSVRTDTAEWAGEAGDRYRETAVTQQDDLDVLTRAAESIHLLVTSAGDMAGSSRAHIQDSVTRCVNDIINRLPDYYVVLNSGHPAALNHVLADAAAVVDSWA